MVRTIIRAMGKSVSLLIAGLGLCAIVVSAQSGNGWQIPPAGRSEQSPLQPTPDVLKKGKSLFGSRCQKCHGPEGKGNGPDSNPDEPAADLTDSSRAAANPDGVLFYKVWNGRKSPKMPAFKSEMSKDDVWSVVAYVKTLRQPA
jgi:mono/diheme cytochrome c family protein